MSKKVWQLRQAGQESTLIINKSPTVLGRGAECDIVIDDPLISDQHLQFNIEGKTLVLHDLQSTNGTLLNGQRIKSTLLSPSGRRTDQLQIGNIYFTLSYGPPVTATQAKQATSAHLDGVAEWYFCSNGVEHGPLTLNQVFEAVDRGELHPTDEFWRAGMDYRVKAFEVEGLFDDETAASAELDLEPISAGAAMCPHCWNRFKPEDVLYIANHPDLLGDPIVGPDEFQRFLPSRFTAEGLAIDAGGIVCPDLACPTCHMRLPAALLKQPPLILSVVGAPGSGKSYFLASATWKLRTTLSQCFGVRFLDVDATTNQWLNDYEEKLFFQADGAEYQAIAKTDMQAPSVYKQVWLNNMPVSLPLPSLFSLQVDGARADTDKTMLSRTLVLYDNAGEHFQAGSDSATAPGTRHLVHAESILFLFDPTEDPRFRALLDLGQGTGSGVTRIHRQDMLLVEMVGRIRKYLGMSSGERLRKTIMVGISKADLLRKHLPLSADPWVRSPGSAQGALDLNAVFNMSQAARSLLQQYAPEVVATVESFADSVVYLPNSALGHNPGKAVRPVDIQPWWVEVPFLYVLASLGYVQSVGRPMGATS